MKKYVLFLIVLSVAASCNVVDGSKLGCQGDELILQNDYQGALDIYLKAVEKNASSNNLARVASVYCLYGKSLEAWPYAHKAVYVNPGNEMAVTNFVTLYVDKIVPLLEIDSWNSSEQEIMAYLGDPDAIISSTDGLKRYLVYGIVGLEFKNHRVCNHYWLMDPMVIKGSRAEHDKNSLSIVKTH